VAAELASCREEAHDGFGVVEVAEINSCPYFAILAVLKDAMPVMRMDDDGNDNDSDNDDDETRLQNTIAVDFVQNCRASKLRSEPMLLRSVLQSAGLV